jgi:N-glycosyltransferase
VVTALFIGVAARLMLPDLVRVTTAWRPDVVVRESLEFSGCVAAELAGVPHVSVVADAECALDLRPRLGEPLDRLRALAGLPPDRDCEMPYRYLHACFMPAEFYGPDAVFAPNTRFCRLATPDHAENGAAQWGDLSRSVPRVLVSFGTVFHRTAGVYDSVIEALATERVRALVASGYDSQPCLVARAAAPHISVARWLPLPGLLAGADVYVTHGGFNSVREAVAAGVPLVVIPMGAGQYYAARCVNELGLGIVVPPDQRTAGRIRAAVAAVASDDSYRRRVRWLKERMTALLDAMSPVSLIERLVAERSLAHGRIS